MIRRPPRSTPLSLHDALPIYQSNGHSVFGITTTILGVNAGIDLADTTLTGSSIDLEAFAGTLNTTVSGGGQNPAPGPPNAAATFLFVSAGTVGPDSGARTAPSPPPTDNPVTPA